MLSAEHHYALALTLSEGIGPVRMREGLKRTGSYKSTWDALTLKTPKNVTLATEANINKTLEDCQTHGIHMLFLDDDAYPELLKHIPDAPHLLYIQGDINVLKRPCVSIVGTRNASANGMRFCEKLASDLAREDLCIVSGLARGIDGAAHTGALAGKGKTIAVLAGGLCRIYPHEHTSLAKNIVASGGALISEMPPMTEPIAPLFPRRNRIVSGLSKAICVMECTAKSGSLITARLALEQNREVFAIPGHPADPRALGPNSLLKQGAHWLESAQDVLTLYKENTAKPETLDMFAPTPHAQEEAESTAQKTEQKLLSLLTTTPTSLDALCSAMQMDAATLNTSLTMLDLLGQITWHGGNKVSKRPS